MYRLRLKCYETFNRCYRCRSNIIITMFISFKNSSIQNYYHLHNFYSNQNKTQSTLSECIAFECLNNKKYFIAFHRKNASSKCSAKPYQTIKRQEWESKRKTKKNYNFCFRFAIKNINCTLNHSQKKTFSDSLCYIIRWLQRISSFFWFNLQFPKLVFWISRSHSPFHKLQQWFFFVFLSLTDLQILPKKNKTWFSTWHNREFDTGGF